MPFLESTARRGSGACRFSGSTTLGSPWANLRTRDTRPVQGHVSLIDRALRCRTAAEAVALRAAGGRQDQYDRGGDLRTGGGLDPRLSRNCVTWPLGRIRV